uniref:Uncharacterized protein n=1 Tax=Arundo donax TaxID=35708 RepID=A0A0A9HM33_ARUDO
MESTALRWPLSAPIATM